MVITSARLLTAGLALGLTAGCTTNGAREREHVRQNLVTISRVESVQVSCNDGWLFAGGDVCASVTMAEGPVLRFRGLGYHSFGRARALVRLEAAGGRVPLVVSCESQVGFADIDRDGLFGHHFSPGLDDVAVAIGRHREVIEELEFWPQCPQFWELGGPQGTLFRYCAHASDTAGEPPPRPCAPSPESTK